MYKSLIAENVIRIIDEKCLSKGAIGRKAGYDIKKFSNMLNGRKIITDVDVMNIANALDVEPNELYGLSPETKRESDSDSESSRPFKAGMRKNVMD